MVDNLSRIWSGKYFAKKGESLKRMKWMCTASQLPTWFSETSSQSLSSTVQCAIITNGHCDICDKKKLMQLNSEVHIMCNLINMPWFGILDPCGNFFLFQSIHVHGGAEFHSNQIIMVGKPVTYSVTKIYLDELSHDTFLCFYNHYVITWDHVLFLKLRSKHLSWCME